MIPTLGRIVLFLLADGPSKGQARPAMIVNVHAGEGTPTASTVVNLQVFMDGDGRAFGDHAPNVVWKTSVAQGTEPGQWQEPARAPVAPAAAEPVKPAGK